MTPTNFNRRCAAGKNHLPKALFQNKLINTHHSGAGLHSYQAQPWVSEKAFCNHH